MVLPGTASEFMLHQAEAKCCNNALVTAFRGSRPDPEMLYRLRQNLQVPADGKPGEAAGSFPESQASKSQQFLRLPVESAKKLRWYDRPDLNNLIQQNLRDKNDLLGVNAALRQVPVSLKHCLAD